MYVVVGLIFIKVNEKVYSVLFSLNKGGDVGVSGGGFLVDFGLGRGFCGCFLGFS